MATTHLFAGIPVASYASSLIWYERLFGRSADVMVSDHESMWQMTSTGWIYVVEDAHRAGSALVTLLMDGLDEQLAALARRGLEPSTIESEPGAYRKAIFTDPEGNTIGFGEVPTTSA